MKLLRRKEDEFMKVISICEISTEETPIIVKGNTNLRGLNYKVPSRTKDADTEIMNMEVKVIEMQFGNLILHVGDIEFI